MFVVQALVVHQKQPHWVGTAAGWGPHGEHHSLSPPLPQPGNASRAEFGAGSSTSTKHYFHRALKGVLGNPKKFRA